MRNYIYAWKNLCDGKTTGGTKRTASNCAQSIFHADEAPFPLRPLALTSNDRRE